MNNRSITRLSHTQLALTAGVLLLCFALFVSDLGWRDLWYDEVGDFLIAAEPLPGILAANRADSLDPPLYYYLLHFWSAIAGKSEVALRFPSVLLVTLAVAITFAWARHWLGFGGGWMTALLLGIMPPVIYYAQEVNQYAGLVFFTSLAVWTAERLDWADQPNWWAEAIFALVSAVGLAWHYGFIWCWFSLNMLFLIRQPNRVALLRWGVSQTIVVAVGGVLFVTVLNAQRSAGSIPAYLEHAYPPMDTALHFLKFFGLAWLGILVFFLGGYYAHSVGLVYMGVGLQVGGLVAGGLARLRSRRSMPEPVMCLVVTGLILMGASVLRLYPFYGGRHLMMFAPLLAAALAWAWEALPRPVAGLGLLITVGVFALGWPHHWAASYSHGENTRALLARLEVSSQPGDGLFVYAESVRSYLYYHPEPRPFTRYGQWWAYENMEGVLEEIDAAVSATPRTWLAFTRCLNIDGICQALFEAVPNRYCELSHWEAGQTRLFLVQSCSGVGRSTDP